MRATTAVAAVVALVATAGCSGKGGQNKDMGADSAVAGPARPVCVVLPDTAYASVKAVSYTVTVSDTTIEPQLASTADLYATAPGGMTFRHGPARDAAFGGRLDSVPTRIEVDWEFHTDEDYTPTDYGTWGGGTGWTGQPLYVQWPDSLLSRFRKAGITHPGFSGREIMVGSLAAKVYFIDFVTGKASRPAIDVTNPIKGTMSLDPTLNGNLYVGQGIPAHGQMGAMVLDLFKSKCTHFFGRDPHALRGWGAYDSSPIRVDRFLFRPGENGSIYKFLIGQGTLTLQTVLRYTVAGRAPGIESSMSVYGNYGFTGDNAGNILAINLNTMQPVWHYKLPDDIDATPVVCVEGDKPYLYVGCEVEHEGVTEAHFVKLDALTGNRIWLNKTPAQRADIGQKHFDGGYYASALPGTGNCKDLIFTNVVQNNDGMNGSFIAYDRATGKQRYSTRLKYYAWSSPVGFVDKNDNMYVVTGDCSGNIYLIDGKDGKIIYRAHVGNNFESSPVVVGNHLVVGSRGKSIYKMTVK